MGPLCDFTTLFENFYIASQCFTNSTAVLVKFKYVPPKIGQWGIQDHTIGDDLGFDLEALPWYLLTH